MLNKYDSRPLASNQVMLSRGAPRLMVLIVSALLTACAATPAENTPQVAVGVHAGTDLVDCRLPGQIRKLGQNATYLAPGRPITTSASDCAIRGGKYVVNDSRSARGEVTDF
jgi:hypothetical protein